jgi:7-carboxy-7-deazaguanine synthase
MAKQLILAKPDWHKEVTDASHTLEIAEMFTDTIQGEGVNTGVPATFLRVQHCSLDCRWCDTEEVWRQGNPYTFGEIFKLMEDNLVIDSLKHEQHLVLTGGSPLRQQLPLIHFLNEFYHKYGFRPYIEVENECTTMPLAAFEYYVSCWNNSPKLTNSGNRLSSRFNLRVLERLSNLPNSWFKFVIDKPEDLKEVLDDFLIPGPIKHEQIILMPCGQTKKELDEKREMVAYLATKYGFRFSDRLHITIWDKKTGV